MKHRHSYQGSATSALRNPGGRSATKLTAGLCLALFVTACADNHQEHAPEISSIGNQSIDQDTSTAALAFTVSDNETAAAQLQVAVTSSNPTLIPQAGLTLAGSGGARTLLVTPASDQSGTAQITITVTDSSGQQTQTQFVLTVRDTRVAFSQYSLTAFNLAVDAEPIDVGATKFVYDNDDQEDAYDAQLQ